MLGRARTSSAVTWGVIAAAVSSALMLWASSPAVGVGWLAWIALVPAASQVVAGRGTRAARLAVPLTYALYLELLLVPALPFGLAAGQWGDPAIPVLVGDSPVLVVALVAIPLAGGALYAIRFGEPWLAERVGPSLEPLALLLVPALAWAALDFIRVKLDPGGYWGPLFTSQADTAAGDISALAGPALITFSIVAVNYGLALALVRRRALAAAAPACAVAALALIGSQVAAGAGQSDAGLTVAAVQPGYDTAEEDRELLRYWEPGTYDLAALDVIADLGDLTVEATRRGAQLVVWPEASMFVDPRREPRVAAALRGVAAATGAVVVAPYFEEARSRSGVVAVVPEDSGPGARLTPSRPKQRPMWFLGEEGGGEPPPEPLPAGRWRVGTLLGVDAQDPGIPAALADGGASLLASSTHDWPALAVEQTAFARLAARAVGLPVVRADWRYGSAIYARNGDELAGTGTDLRRTVLVAEVAPGERTPYARIGDVVGWTTLAISLLVGAAALAMRAPRLRTRAGSPRRGGGGPARRGGCR
jgi:apolipoprotein N-acyltransferase